MHTAQFGIFLTVISVTSLSNPVSSQDIKKSHAIFHYFVSVCNVGECRRYRNKVRCNSTICEREELLYHPVDAPAGTENSTTFSFPQKTRKSLLTCVHPNHVIDVKDVIYQAPKDFDSFCTTKMEACLNKPNKEGECTKPQQCNQEFLLPNDTYKGEICEYRYEDVIAKARQDCLKQGARCKTPIERKPVKNFDTCGKFDPDIIDVDCSDESNHCYPKWITILYTCQERSTYKKLRF